MAQDDEDDYLSDKFLALPETTAAKATTYADRRKRALKNSQLKNERNKLKGRKERELDSREEGLAKSLFQRAQEEAAETGKQNKALAIMMKMGFQPGQSLGGAANAAVAPAVESNLPPVDAFEESQAAEPSTRLQHQVQHRVEPLAIKEWTGKTGIGGVKRPPSPSALERAGKVARQAEQLSADQFRDRARLEYEERRAEGRLKHSQSTCVTLDTKEGIQFNPYWLDPTNPESFPPGLLDALEDTWTPSIHIPKNDNNYYSHAEQGDSIKARLKSQMQADALHSLSAAAGPENHIVIEAAERWSKETLSDITAFLRMSVPHRLIAVLEYLRDKYNYCFWCGTQYGSVAEMNEQCPGSDEDQHD